MNSTSPSVSQIVQMVHNKFTNYMQKEVDQWEASEAIREKQELGYVKGLLLNHEENCRKIYIVSLVMGIISAFFYSFSSPGILLGGLSWILVGVLFMQLVTVRMRQRKALYYVELVDNLIANKLQTSVLVLVCNLFSTTLLVCLSGNKEYQTDMWPVLFRVVRTYAPYITLPFAGLVGIIGYNLENLMSDKFTPYQKSISQQRKERQEAEAEKIFDDISPLKERKFVARTVFEKNLSPSLQN